MEEALISYIISPHKCEVCLLTGKHKEDRVVAILSSQLLRKNVRLVVGAKLRVNLEQGRYVIRDYDYKIKGYTMTSGGAFDYD